MGAEAMKTYVIMQKSCVQVKETTMRFLTSLVLIVTLTQGGCRFTPFIKRF